MSAWHTGFPPMSGYYLATWLPGYVDVPDRAIVSELWFNKPDSKKDYGEWWTARGYLGQKDERPCRWKPLEGVVAWMRMPDPHSVGVA